MMSRLMLRCVATCTSGPNFADTGAQETVSAAVFAACKIEDTLKKSREVLTVAFNGKVSQIIGGATLSSWNID